VILQKLAAKTKAGQLKLDAIIIETTGMADPAPVAQSFLVHSEIAEFARLDGVVVMVDAKHVERQLNAKKPEGVVNEAVAQVAFADRLLLNKTDLVSKADVARVEARLRGINPFAPVQRCTRGDVSVDRVLGIYGFDLQRALKVSPELLNAAAAPTQHDKSVTSVSLDQGAARHLRTVMKGDLDLELAQDWFGEMLAQQGDDIYRMKGVLAIAHAKQKFIYHAVHARAASNSPRARATSTSGPSRGASVGLAQRGAAERLRASRRCT
jgi:G3E family GTPase